MWMRHSMWDGEAEVTRDEVVISISVCVCGFSINKMIVTQRMCLCITQDVIRAGGCMSVICLSGDVRLRVRVVERFLDCR